MTSDLPPLVVNAALTGMVPTKADNPALPITPEEIAEDAGRCVQAGAAIVHLHARDEHGAPTYRREVYAADLNLQGAAPTAPRGLSKVPRSPALVPPRLVGDGHHGEARR